MPGAADVIAAIDKKDYDGAMAALMKVKQTVTTDEQNVQFMVLARQARARWTKRLSTNTQAAEAVMTLRAMTPGYLSEPPLLSRSLSFLSESPSQ